MLLWGEEPPRTLHALCVLLTWLRGGTSMSHDDVQLPHVDHTAPHKLASPLSDTCGLSHMAEPI